jgi:imipenem/basic amino acid-specific outer membrane pore
VITFKKNRRIRMKKTLVSLAAASLIVISAMAADKGIDIVITG